MFLRAGEAMKITVLAADTVFRVTVPRGADLPEIFGVVKAERHRNVINVFGNCSTGDVTFYRLEPAPRWDSFAFDADLRVVTNANHVLSTTRKVTLSILQPVEVLFGVHPDENCVSLFIERVRDANRATQDRLDQQFAELLRCLVVHSTGVWRQDDIATNNAIFVQEMATVPQYVHDLIARLSMRRRYKIQSGEQLRENCRSVLGDTFDDVFISEDVAGPGAPGPAVDYPVEFAYFEHITFFPWSVDINGFKNATRCSEQKAALVTARFVAPPVDSHVGMKRARLAVGVAWPFNMFVKSHGVLYTHHPKSGFSYTTYDEEQAFPMMIGEVISDDYQSDRWRMLCQAIALVRLGNFLSGNRPSVVIMAVYVENEFQADRYLLYMREANEAHVHIIRDRFNLLDVGEGMAFLLGLYNFGIEISRMASGFTMGGFTQLKSLVSEATNLPALSSRRENTSSRTSQGMRASVSDGLATLPEGATESIQSAVNASEHMQVAMQQLGLTDDLFMVLGNPFVALVNSRVEAGRQYYLKLLRPGRTVEVNILSYLANIESPDNHAVRPIASRACQREVLLLLPNAGIPIIDYQDCEAHLVSIASQFLRGVAFLHEHKVAHCDLKTSNVVVDCSTGRVTLIDFDLAVHNLIWLDGFSGTDGWTAPEVGTVARYNATQADIWAAGKVLRSVAWKCFASPDRQFLLDLSEKMMAIDPNVRPSMKKVVEALDVYVASHGGSKSSSASFGQQS